VSAVSAPEGARRIATAFESHGKRAALMPYLMGGYPSVEVSLAAGEAAAITRDASSVGKPPIR
jgi:tryptophan synthase alpha chain